MNFILTLGRIQKFTSLYNSPIIFIKKKNKNNPLRRVIIYYGLNGIIILIYYPIFLINKLQNYLAGAMTDHMLVMWQVICWSRDRSRGRA